MISEILHNCSTRCEDGLIVPRGGAVYRWPRQDVSPDPALLVLRMPLPETVTWHTVPGNGQIKGKRVRSGEGRQSYGGGIPKFNVLHVDHTDKMGAR